MLIRHQIGASRHRKAQKPAHTRAHRRVIRLGQRHRAMRAPPATCMRQARCSLVIEPAHEINDLMRRAQASPAHRPCKLSAVDRIAGHPAHDGMASCIDGQGETAQPLVGQRIVGGKAAGRVRVVFEQRRQAHSLGPMGSAEGIAEAGAERPCGAHDCRGACEAAKDEAMAGRDGLLVQHALGESKAARIVEYNEAYRSEGFVHQARARSHIRPGVFGEGI